MRTGRVRSPRSARNASSADGMAPPSERRVVIASAWAASAATTAPMSTSLWPEMYFVAECTTRSTPSVEGLLQQGRREGVVDGDERAVPVRGRSERGDVGDLERRVRGRLEPEHRGALARRRHGAGVGDVDVLHGDAAGRRAVVELQHGARVRVPRRHDPPAGSAPGRAPPRPRRCPTRMRRTGRPRARRGCLRTPSTTGCRSARTRVRRPRHRSMRGAPAR